jgi:hypothetical protein
MGVFSMNAKQLYDHADNIANNPFLRLIGTFSMSLATPIVAVGITWGGNTLWNINNATVELKGQVVLLSTQLASAVKDRYTANDATKDAKAQTILDAEQTRRLNSLDARVDRLENRPH